MTNRHNRVLYTAVTNDIQVRASQHKEKSVRGFTKRYNVTKLVYYEIFDDIDAAIAREKQIKAGSRRKKIILIEKMNPKWNDCMIHYEIGRWKALAMTCTLFAIARSVSQRRSNLTRSNERLNVRLLRLKTLAMTILCGANHNMNMCNP